MQDIKVSVVEFGDRKYYMMQYRDPMNGHKTTRSTKVERTGRKQERTEAERVAAKWESELREGRYHRPDSTTWEDFREKYETEILPGLADATALKVDGVFNAVETIINPQKVRDITAARVSYLQSKLREGGRSENTISGHLAHLKAALNHAVNWGMLPKLPKIAKTKRAKTSKKMKGRPITGEEFDRLLLKTPSVVGEEAAESWKYYLNGLWLSGLRLAESLELYWDRDDRLCVDLSGNRPILLIPACHEKGNEDRDLPMSPEFANFLLKTPESDRTGRVFNPLAQRRHGGQLTKDRISRLIGKIGQKAGVKVWTHPVSGKVKHASAHDLRRSFGLRWASRVMPQVLMELMRHESIDTTMKYYVGKNAQATADVLWQAHEQASGNTFGNTSSKNSEGAGT